MNEINLERRMGEPVEGVDVVRARPVLKLMAEEQDQNPDPKPENPGSWLFYLHPRDGYRLDRDIAARLAYDPYYEAFFYYIGKLNKTKSVSRCKFSRFEACYILEFLEKILNQIDRHPTQGRSFKNLIPFFDGNNLRATPDMNKNKRELFWTDADLYLQTVRIKLIMNLEKGEYNLVLNNMVSVEVTEDQKGWLGPEVIITFPAMRQLERYLSDVRTCQAECEAL